MYCNRYHILCIDTVTVTQYDLLWLFLTDFLKIPGSQQAQSLSLHDFVRPFPTSSGLLGSPNFEHSPAQCSCFLLFAQQILGSPGPFEFCGNQMYCSPINV